MKRSFALCLFVLLAVTPSSACSKKTEAPNNRLDSTAVVADTAKSDSARADSIAGAEANDDKPCFASHLGLPCNN